MTTKAKVFLSVEERKWRKQFRRKLQDRIKVMTRRLLNVREAGDEAINLSIDLDKIAIDKVMSEIMEYREIVLSKKESSYVEIIGPPRTLYEAFEEEYRKKRGEDEAHVNL